MNSILDGINDSELVRALVIGLAGGYLIFRLSQKVYNNPGSPWWILLLAAVVWAFVREFSML
jgi:hypothetical protein